MCFSILSGQDAESWCSENRFVSSQQYCYQKPIDTLLTIVKHCEFANAGHAIISTWPCKYWIYQHTQLNRSIKKLSILWSTCTSPHAYIVNRLHTKTLTNYTEVSGRMSLIHYTQRRRRHQDVFESDDYARVTSRIYRIVFAICAVPERILFLIITIPPSVSSKEIIQKFYTMDKVDKYLLRCN